MIKVLWIDDQHEELSYFIDDAFINGIDVTSFSNVQEGMSRLENNPDEFHAVILDAITFRDKSDTIPSEKGLHEAYVRVIKFNTRKEIPSFIFSGQTRITQGGLDYLNLPTFDKAGDTKLLFDAIKGAVAKQPENQLRNKYKDVFSIFEQAYLGIKPERYLLDCLLQMDSLTVGLNRHNEDFLNRIRKILEALFYALHTRGLLPSGIVNGNLLQLNDARKFMNGEFLEIEGNLVSLAEDARFPKSIGNSVTYLLHKTNFASHHNEPGFDLADAERNETELKEYNVSPYLLHSLTYQLMDVLYWFKHYADRYSDVEENKKLIQIRGKEAEGEMSPINGKLQHDGKYYHVENCAILRKIVDSEGWKVGDEISLPFYILNNKEDGYKYFCPSFKR